MDSLYLIGLTLKEENLHYLPVGRPRSAEGSSQIMYQGLSMMVPFTGKIRLVKNFIKEPCINTNYQKAIAFETVLDIVLRCGQVVSFKNRSLEMGQKREALKRLNESANRLKNMDHRKATALTTNWSTTRQNPQVINISDRWEGIEQAGCLLKEYYESAARLKKVLYTYGLDIDLE